MGTKYTQLMQEFVAFQEALELKNRLTGIRLSKTVGGVRYLVATPEVMTFVLFRQVQPMLKVELQSELSSTLFGRQSLYCLAIKNRKVVGFRAMRWLEYVTNLKMTPTSRLMTFLFGDIVVAKQHRRQGIGTAMTRFLMSDGFPAFINVLRGYEGKWLEKPMTVNLSDGSGHTFTDADLRAALSSGKGLLRCEFEHPEEWMEPFSKMAESLPFFQENDSDAQATMRASNGLIEMRWDDADGDGKKEKEVLVQIARFANGVRENTSTVLVLGEGIGFRRYANGWLSAIGLPKITNGRNHFFPVMLEEADLLPTTAARLTNMGYTVVDISKAADQNAALREAKAKAKKKTIFVFDHRTSVVKAWGFQL